MQLIDKIGKILRFCWFKCGKRCQDYMKRGKVELLLFEALEKYLIDVGIVIVDLAHSVENVDDLTLFLTFYQ